MGAADIVCTDLSLYLIFSEESGITRKFLLFRPLEERKEASRRVWGPQFSKILNVVDGKVFPLARFNKSDAESLYLPAKYGRQDYMNFKIKPSCISVLFQIVCDADKWVSYVSTQKPAGVTNDPAQWSLCIDDVMTTSGFDRNALREEVFCTDGVYGKTWATDRGLTTVCPHRKPNNADLSPQKEEENRKLSERRGDIERLFGHFCSTFPWAAAHGNGYQAREKFFPTDLRLCFSIMNLKLLLKWAPDLDPRFRHHPVFNEEFATDSFEAPVVQGSASESESDLFGNEFGESFDEEAYTPTPAELFPLEEDGTCS